MASIREGSVILFENAEGQLAFQLRDDRPDVAYPNHWGVFGGWQAAGESPEQAIVREIKEELDLELDPARLRYLRGYRDGDVISHVFYYRVEDEFQKAVLSEGQRLEFIRFSDLETRKVVPRHRSIVAWYARQKNHSG